MERGPRFVFGVVLIVVGALAVLWPGAAQIYGTWGGILKRVPLVPFALMCGGLWLILRPPPEGAK